MFLFFIVSVRRLCSFFSVIRFVLKSNTKERFLLVPIGILEQSVYLVKTGHHMTLSGMYFVRHLAFQIIFRQIFYRGTAKPNTIQKKMHSWL